MKAFDFSGLTNEQLMNCIRLATDGTLREEYIVEIEARLAALQALAALVPGLVEAAEQANECIPCQESYEENKRVLAHAREVIEEVGK